LNRRASRPPKRIGEVAFEAGQAQVQVACEDGPPAFLEDRAVQALDVAVGLWAPGTDLAVSGAGGQCGGEGPAAELVAVDRLYPLGTAP
jgi:hypothetical protein